MTITTAGTLGPISVVTQGVSNMDFVIAPSVAPDFMPVRKPAVSDVSAQPQAGTLKPVPQNNVPVYACSVPGSYSVGQSCTVNVKFSPLAPGLRPGAVVLTNSSGTVLGTTYIYGVGLGPILVHPQFTTYPGVTLSSLVLKGNYDFAIDLQGNLYVANQGNNSIDKFAAGTLAKTTIASGGLKYVSVAIDGAGNLFAAGYPGLGQTALGEIDEFVGGTGSPVAITPSNLNYPGLGLTVDASGNVYETLSGELTGLHNIVRVAAGTHTLTTFGTGLFGPSGIAISPLNGLLYVSYANNSEIESMNPDGTNPQPVNTNITSPGHGTFDPAGNLYIPNNSGRVYMLPAGNLGEQPPPSVLPTPVFTRATAVVLDSLGNLLVSDEQYSNIDTIDRTDAKSLPFYTTTAVNTLDTDEDGQNSATFTNIGNAALTITSPQSGGNPSYPSGFLFEDEQSSLCTQVVPGEPTETVPVNGTCTFYVGFEPTVSGSNSGDIVLTDRNFGGAWILANLSGTGYIGDATSTSVGSSSYSIGLGQPVTLTATVSDTTNMANIPIGSVSFSDTIGMTTVTLNGSVALNGNTATLSGVALAGDGIHTIRATFSGNAPVQEGGDRPAPLRARVKPADVPTNNGFDPSSNTTNITVGAAVSFSVAALSPQVMGAPFTFTVTALDANKVPSTLYAGTLAITSGDAAAVLPQNATLTNGYGVFTITLNTLGSQTIIATDTVTNTITGQTSVQVNPPPAFTVTVGTDTTQGVAGNCTNQSLTGATLDPNCSLRDALAAAAAFNAPGGTAPVTVNFATALTNAPITILLANGQMNLPSYTTVAGAVSVNGGNLIAIDGNNKGAVFNVANGIAGAEIDYLILTDGNSDAGGGVYNNGALKLFGVTVSGNTAPLGGGIFNTSNANLTLIDTTVSGNSAAESGGIFNAGVLSITNSTIANNTAAFASGGIYSQSGTLTLTDVTVAGNSLASPGATPGIGLTGGTATFQNTLLTGNLAAGVESDCHTTGPACPVSGTNGNLVTGLGNLASLGNYGGATQTLLPLPGSAAICAGTSAGPNYDQRSVGRPVIYGTQSCTDSGAVQTNYALAFVQQPSNAQVNGSMTPAPSVQVKENGKALGLSGIAVTIAAAAGAPGGTLTESTGPTGVATFSGVSFNTGETSDSLTASISVGEMTATATSGTFNILTVDHLGITVPQSVRAGLQISVTVTGFDSNNNVVPGYTGPVTFTSSDAQALLPVSTQLVSGSATLTNVYLRTVGNQTVTATDASGSPTITSSNVLVSAGSAAKIQRISGTPQSAMIGAQIPNPLVVKVTDLWNNPISGITVTYTAPSTGASATLTTPALTSAEGTTSAVATANGNASANSYLVSASIPIPPIIDAKPGTGLGLAAKPSPQGGCSAVVLGGKPHAGITGCSPTTNFTLTNTQATPTLTVTPTSLSLTYGQPVTLNAVLSPLSIAGSGPTGTVTFFDGEDSLTPASTVTNAAASYPISVPTTGPHSYTGGYSGDANFSLTHSIPVPVTVNKASVTATYSVNSPVFVVSGQSGSIPFTLNGQFNGPGIAVPSGSDMLYAIVDSGSVTVQSGQLELSSASATVPISNTLSPGVYTVTLQYGGDGNYLDNQSLATIGLQVGQLQPVINWTTPTPIPYGAGLYGILDAVAVSNQQPSDNVRVRRQTPGQALSGTYSYTATPAAGKAFPVSSVTTLSAGTYTLTVNFTPDPSIASVYTTATGSVRLSVLQVPPGNQLSADVNPVLKLNPVTFTAIMTGVGQEPAVVGSRGIQARARGNESNGGANPTGSVTFLDGATPLGTATVDEGGIATFVTSALAVGSHPVTALYSGDSNYIAATSGQVTELVQDFNLTISISGGGSAGTTSVTTTPGGTAIYSFTLSPVGSATFPATVTLSASGLPANATYTFLPASLPAGSGPTPVTLTIVLAPVTAASLQPAASHAGGTVEGTKASNSPRLPYLALALLLLPFAGRMRKTGRKLGRLLPLLVLLISGVAATMGITGCGSSSTGYFGQASKTYTIAVTGTSGSLTHSTTVTLTVQ